MSTPMLLECTLSLPEPYRWQEFMAFHSRDASQSAERLDRSAQRLLKALHWQGHPALLVLHWQGREVVAQLFRSPDMADEVEKTHQNAREQADLQAMLKRMLGQVYPPSALEQVHGSALEQAHGNHPELGLLLARQPGLHVPAAPTPFEALNWAIMGQQISVAVAVAMRRKLIALAGAPLPLSIAQAVPQAQGMSAYPDATCVAALDIEHLRTASFSQAKAATLLAVANAIHSGALPLEDWARQSDEGLWTQSRVNAATEKLLAIKGIGPWTVNYCLLRGYGWPDGSLHGDVAVRKAIGLLTHTEKPDAATARVWLDQFQPWRALVAAHLWASLSTQAY